MDQQSSGAEPNAPAILNRGQVKRNERVTSTGFGLVALSLRPHVLIVLMRKSGGPLFPHAPHPLISGFNVGNAFLECEAGSMVGFRRLLKYEGELFGFGGHRR